MLSVLNFYNLQSQSEQWGLVTYCVTCGFDYEQAADLLREKFDCYMPEDQYDAITEVLNIQMALDVGNRKGEGERKLNSEGEG